MSKTGSSKRLMEKSICFCEIIPTAVESKINEVLISRDSENLIKLEDIIVNCERFKYQSHCSLRKHYMAIIIPDVR